MISYAAEDDPWLEIDPEPQPELPNSLDRALGNLAHRFGLDTVEFREAFYRQLDQVTVIELISVLLQNIAVDDAISFLQNLPDSFITSAARSVVGKQASGIHAILAVEAQRRLGMLSYSVRKEQRDVLLTFLPNGHTETVTIRLGDVFTFPNQDAAKPLPRAFPEVVPAPKLWYLLSLMATFRLPPNHGPEREQAIFDAVKSGQAEVVWAPVYSTFQNHTGVFLVFADALKIDGVRVNACAATMQKLADLMDCSLLTAKLADLIWEQRAVTLTPHTMPITATTAAMQKHSALIDQELNTKGGNPTGGLVSTTGKHWILDNDLGSRPIGTAMNYGWHFEGPSFGGLKGEVVATLRKDPKGQYHRLIQGRGTAHDKTHSDYSQTVSLVAQGCTVDGQPKRLLEVFQDPDLAGLIHHQGVLKVTRQPGVPEITDRVSYLPSDTVVAAP